MSTATQATDLLAAWERYNASLEALIESADGEYQEQQRFSAFRAGYEAALAAAGTPGDRGEGADG